MKRVAKILLLIWSILMTPAIILTADFETGLTILSVPVIRTVAIFSGFFVLLTQGIFLPQIITLALNVVYIIGLCRDRYLISMKKEIPQYIVLAIWSVIGAVYCFIIFLMFCEAPPQPLP
jgi:hypothetical protein